MTRKHIPPSIERPGRDNPPKAVPWHQVMIVGGEVIELIGGRVYMGPDPILKWLERIRREFSEY